MSVVQAVAHKSSSSLSSCLGSMGFLSPFRLQLVRRDSRVRRNRLKQTAHSSAQDFDGRWKSAIVIGLAVSERCHRR